ncbi:MAG TPA: LysR substrate-binding domain-containing protein [Pseudolysinimonas sp.]|jgi:DNA-binding transcriptional LysR family regulator|nr:LysR substrate-binding domain-containing protein [Pseudolysinimonas sp.]
MNLTLDQLRTTVAVAREASFSEAARTLILSQPAVTRTVRTVEGMLGTQLFTRTTRRVTLTADGVQFVAVAEEILSTVDNGVRRFEAYRRAESGTLTVVALPSLAAGFLPAVLAPFLAARGDVQVRLVTGTAADVLDRLRRGGADVAITEAPGPLADLHSLSLGSDAMLAAVPPGHDLAGATAITWRQLAEHPFIALDEGTSVRRLADRGFADAGANPPSRTATDSIGAAAAMVRSGLGLSAFPESTLHLAVGTDLGYVRLIDPVVARELAVLVPRTPAPSSLARAFIDDVLAARGAEGLSVAKAPPVRP